ncbi:hypothetical protein [Caldimonas tepidiphila]|uniref:hypothetical protein n=1 Tax=Caldimonas tepidiphila TaxID=2315841 RepID=UPI000E5AA011|nr:hypothetical protein [Caldimonas tepidiphila]
MSNRQSIPDDLRRFVLTSVPSVPYLEAVLLLLRAEPGRECSLSDVARALYVSERIAGELLQALVEAGVAQAGGAGGYRYGPADPALAAMLERLAQAYAQDLIAITNLIHDRVQKNAQRFADAFRLKER